MQDWTEEYPLDLESWLRIHYPKILIKYEKIKENIIKE